MNVLWICTDQQRFDTLGCYGNPWVKTPNIDRLAQMGVKFDRAYAQCPVCGPSRASFLTGRYPRTCGVRQNGQDMQKDEILLPKLLHMNGYYCGLAGKLHISACHDSACKIMEPRIDDGYDFFRWSHHPAAFSGTNWPMNEYSMWLAEKGTDYITPDRTECKYIQTGMPEDLHQTTWCTNQAIQFMESAKRYHLPWFFSLNYFDPHHPFDPPKEYLERYLSRLEELELPDYVEKEWETKPVFQKTDHFGAYDTEGLFPFEEMSPADHRYIRAAYFAMIDLIDHQVGRLLDWLEINEQLNDTLIIFTSDHGESLGDHGMYLKGPYFYESSVHVPLIFTCPGKIKGGRTSNALVELTDISETVCEAAGIQKAAGMQGMSLWPLLTGERMLNKHRNNVYSEYYNSNINHRLPLAFVTMVYDGRYKLCRVHDPEEKQQITGELYDLAADPGEHHNLYYEKDAEDVKILMLEKLSDRMAQTCDPLPVRKAFW